MNLDPEVRNEIENVLLVNADLFAWEPSDMPGIDPEFLCHKLAICPEANPVAQRKHRIGEERRRVVEQETSKLLKANFIREIMYTTWLANSCQKRKRQMAHVHRLHRSMSMI